MITLEKDELVNLTTLKTNLEDLSLNEMIGKMADIYQIIFLGREDYLTDRERTFFIACVIISNSDFKYLNSKGYATIVDIFNLKRKSDIRQYIRTLENKNWITSNKKTKEITVNEFFKIDLKDQKIKVEMQIDYAS